MLQIHIADFNYDIGKNIKDNKRDFVIINRFKQDSIRKNGCVEKIKKYNLHCNICNADVSLTQSQIEHGTQCPCCTNKQVVVGINDIPTTDPWMIPYFQGGYDEAKNYTHGSGKKIYPKCPYCGRISNIKTYIYNIYRQNTIACVCKDSVSYPEKFIYNLLCQSEEDFKFQLTKNDYKWVGKYRYDFYLIRQNTIIEVNGLQHYKKNAVIQNDENKRNLAQANGVKYIALDCRYSNCEYIKNSLFNSGLVDIINLNKINWGECNDFAKKNLCKEICELFEMGFSVTNLSEKYKLSNNSIRRMLHTGNQIGLCNYDGKKENAKSSIGNENNIKKTSIYTTSGTYIGTYKSAKYIADHSKEIVGKNLRVNSIYDCCNGRIKQYKGYVFINKGDKVAI
mgnify:CR=1 FL=1